ncbi:putative COQ5-ubiquinone biosynthesis, methyltransferase [Ceraceosorus guamensis]|uniref:2-methoxy-6-polyprenyl-1,4-benzoquinol methylase, mitochondrial n=1 Tax=Ceraceosorus guamensis TaxID=1522189 RepID=A0A316VT72_9BASI|nr:putative COQ5-ubiquinone biosynthesis, methyltransferase [Ceraceosorus guamensis]PWN40786.1 putative COQ5-ubiquinone biosynthesis, methyltransferase [Ceraceosorus guamensis]
MLRRQTLDLCERSLTSRLAARRALHASCTRGQSSTSSSTPGEHNPSSSLSSNGSSSAFPDSRASAGGEGTTHFGYQDVPLSSKVDLVRGVFSSVASSYDVMNDAMSVGVHRLWKDHFVAELNPRGGIKCLDVAGGTGDIGLRLLDHAREKHSDRQTQVTLLDINPSMLRAGQRRLAKTMYWNTDQLRFALGNAEDLRLHLDSPPPKSPLSAFAASPNKPKLPPLEHLEIEDESVDLYTIAFGIRNCTHIDKVLKEAHRVLKPGGVFACLEFGKVNVPGLSDLYRAYSHAVLPSLGAVLASDRASYQYLVESIERFPTQPDFARMVAQAGFHLPGSPQAERWGLPAYPEQRSWDGDESVNGAWEDLSFGIATIWKGMKL